MSVLLLSEDPELVSRIQSGTSGEFDVFTVNDIEELVLQSQNPKTDAVYIDFCCPVSKEGLKLIHELGVTKLKPVLSIISPEGNQSDGFFSMNNGVPIFITRHLRAEVYADYVTLAIVRWPEIKSKLFDSA